MNTLGLEKYRKFGLIAVVLTNRNTAAVAKKNDQNMGLEGHFEAGVSARLGVNPELWN